MVRQARQCIVVADSSKLGHASPAVVCTAKEIGCLITDDGVPEDLVRRFEAAGVKVTVV
jgi:DeoR family transcriptional regulator, aga operon transcriptional repressor